MSTLALPRPRMSRNLVAVLGLLMLLGLLSSLTSCAPKPALALAPEGAGRHIFDPAITATPTLNYEAMAQSISMQVALITAQAQQRDALARATASERAWQLQQAQATETAQAHASATAQAAALTATPAYATQVAIIRAIDRQNFQDNLAHRAAPWWVAFKISAAFLFLYLAYSFISRLMPARPAREDPVRRTPARQGKPLPLAEDELLGLARALQRGVPFDEAHLGTRALRNLPQVQEAAVSSGLARWIDPADRRRGCELTSRGKQYFFGIVLKGSSIPAPQISVLPPLTRRRTGWSSVPPRR